MFFRCSENQVLQPGTATKDVVCKHSPDNPTLATTLPTTSPAVPFPIAVPGESLYNIAFRAEELGLTVKRAIAHSLTTGSRIPFSYPFPVLQTNLEAYLLRWGQESWLIYMQ